MMRDRTYSGQFVRYSMMLQSYTRNARQHTSLQATMFFCILSKDRHMYCDAKLPVDIPPTTEKVHYPSKDVDHITNRIVPDIVSRHRTTHSPLTHSSMV